jgi:hypothetical protein
VGQTKSSDDHAAGPDPSFRSAAAYEVARRLIYFSSAEHPDFSLVGAAREKLNKLLAMRLIPSSEHHDLASLLSSLCGCDLDRCERIGDLTWEVAMNLTAWVKAFPDTELERLRDLM